MGAGTCAGAQRPAASSTTFALGWREKGTDLLSSGVTDYILGEATSSLFESLKRIFLLIPVVEVRSAAGGNWNAFQVGAYSCGWILLREEFQDIVVEHCLLFCNIFPSFYKWLIIRVRGGKVSWWKQYKISRVHQSQFLNLSTNAQLPFCFISAI